MRERNVLPIVRCIIVARIPRSRCPSHGTHFIDVPWAGERSDLTRRFELDCLHISFISNPTVAARAFNLNSNMVWNIVMHYVDSMMRELGLSELKSIHIDETQCKNRHNYITTVIDKDTKAGIFATLGNDMSTIQELRYWMTMHNGKPEDIRLICCDMSKAYISGIRQAFPSAMLVFDRFHGWVWPHRWWRT